MRGRAIRASAAPLAAAGLGACALRGLTFVAPPNPRGGAGSGPVDRGAVGLPGPAAGGLQASGKEAQTSEATTRMLVLLSLAGGLGAGASSWQLTRDAAGGRDRVQRRVLPPKVDWQGSATRWGTIEERSILDVDWRNVHGVLSISSVALFLYQMVRIALHQAPTMPEVWITTAIYLPWTVLCWKDTAKLEEHYRVTFYASCGWAVMSLASLHAVVNQDKQPELAFNILAAGNVVFIASCVYFYTYHWSRMWRHYQQNRFRPLWIPGLLGLMCLHGLTIADFAKRLDDMGWWKTVCLIYPDEWWWVADVRIIELFVTAAALWLIILHIQGVFTGMKNAAIVVIGTIFLPLVVMVLESTWLRASSWQHYFMVGPKYW